MEIYIVPCLADNYSYILKDENIISVVDPGEFSAIDNFLNKNDWKLNFILNTHHHRDHTGGNIPLKKKYSCIVLGSSIEKLKFQQDHNLTDNESFKLGACSFQTLLLPGHTLGQISFYFEKENALFTGDTLFSMGCGRLFEGTAEQMYESLQRIKKLPNQTRIYCGHEYAQKNAEFCLAVCSNKDIEEHYKKILNLRSKNQPTVPTTLELELKINPFLKSDTLTEFIRLRELRNQW